MNLFLESDPPGVTDLPRIVDRFVASLPADPEADNFRRQVAGACYSRVAPTPVRAPARVAVAREVAALLDLPDAFVASDAFVQVMAGNALLPGMVPHAMCYGGHQFGNWAGQLGDGRAIVLGEVVNQRGEHWALQLKGAGPTPYSRTADGLAVLRSSVREFLCSEAMHHLGVPTTRALSLVTTGEQVVRDMFYDGHPRPEPGAVVCRVAPSFLRFGNFELPASRGDTELLRRLVEFTIRTEFPQCIGPGGSIDDDAIQAWFETVCRRTAAMIVEWMRVGFVHGVMNTDNMSILGLTIDYGPYGWLDDYDPDWTPNTTDAGGKRYRYAHQPQIALWNLAMLGNALVPLVSGIDGLQAALGTYRDAFESGWRGAQARRLGLADDGLADNREIDDRLFDGVRALMRGVETDMTLFHRLLADVPGVLDERLPDAVPDAELVQPLHEAFYSPDTVPREHREALAAWLRAWIDRVGAERMATHEWRTAMHAVNPKYVLRNYMAQLAIDAAEQGDFSVVEELLDLLRRPYDEQPDRARWFARRPEWARERAGCSMLSCSS